MSTATKLKKAAQCRSNVANNHFYTEGDKVFYQEKDRTAWLGPSKVFCQRGKEVYVFANGNIKKLHTCRVKPFKCVNESDNLVGQNDKEVSINEEANKVHQAISEEFPVVNKDFECSDVANHVDSEELKKDTIGTFWMTVGQNECFQEEITTWTRNQDGLHR